MCWCPHGGSERLWLFSHSCIPISVLRSSVEIYLALRSFSCMACTFGIWWWISSSISLRARQFITSQKPQLDLFGFLGFGMTKTGGSAENGALLPLIRLVEDIVSINSLRWALMCTGVGSKQFFNSPTSWLALFLIYRSRSPLRGTCCFIASKHENLRLCCFISFSVHSTYSVFVASTMLGVKPSG